MHSIKAIYDGTNFKAMQPIPVKENYEVIITFVEPMKENTVNIEESVKRPLSEMRGIWKGKISISDDFNDPIEEMKEYME